MKHLTPTNLYAIPIPSDEQRKWLGTFCSDEEVGYQLTRLGLNGKESSKPFLNFHSKSKFNGGVIYNVELPEGEYEILGMATKDELNFNAQPYVIKDNEILPASLTVVWGLTLKRFRVLLEDNQYYFQNPYLHLGTEKPDGYVLVSYDGGETFDEYAEWLSERKCMLAGISGGNGYFGEGWGTTGLDGVDKGLIVDAPDYWIYASDFKNWSDANRNIHEQYLIIEKTNQ